MKNIAVLGAGSWGIALSRQIQRKGFNIKLWEFDKTLAQNLAADREDKKKLPGVILSPEIEITNSMSHAITNADTILIVTPSKFFRGTIKSLAKLNPSSKINYIIATKGIEQESLMTMPEILKAEINSAENIAVLTGPSHAEEVGRDMPTTIVAASANVEFSKDIQKSFSGGALRIYTNTDMLGVALAGSLKNVIAVAAGISDGIGYGDNAKGALLTRGMAEITRLGACLGAQPTTFFGLAGIGDLITTCISKHSRNRFVGEELGKGRKLSDILGGMIMIAEGVETAKSAYMLGKKCGVDLPITNQVYEVLFNNKNPHTAVKELMTREFKGEGE